MTPGRRAAALGAVFLAALAVRLLWVRAADPGPLKGDAAEYFAYAGSLRAGRFAGPGGERAARMPGYPAFVAGVQTLFGEGPRPVLRAQAVVGAAGAVATALAVEAAASTPWGVAAGLAAALARDSAEPAGWPLSEALFAALLAAAFAAPGLRRPGPAARAAAAGLLWGAAFLTRPEVLPLGALALALLPVSGVGASRRDAAVGLAALALAPALWAARNLAVLGRPLPATSSSATVRYLGLRHPAEALGLSRAPRYEPPADVGELERGPGYAAAERALRAELGTAGVAKARLLNAGSIWYPFLPAYDAAFVFLLPLWAAGLWAARRRPGLWAAALLPPALTGVYCLYGGFASRYRFGFAPALLLVAGVGAAAAWERLGGRRAAAALAVWAAANAALFAAAPRARELALSVKAALF
ncbi:hypothetical protein EPO15_03390 [bacterium]|nr:MAG: hypothetical protein EPO15_03390 [bacterium]